MATLSRQDIASWAGITLRQLDHFGTAGVAAADVGGERKRFSLLEARLAVIAGRCLKNGMTPRALVEPIAVLREYAQWPAIEGLPVNLSEIEDMLKKHQKTKRKEDQWTQLENALNFELACRGERDLFFHIAPRWKSPRAVISRTSEKIDDEAIWFVINIRVLFRERDVRYV